MNKNIIIGILIVIVIVLSFVSFNQRNNVKTFSENSQVNVLPTPNTPVNKEVVEKPKESVVTANAKLVAKNSDPYPTPEHIITGGPSYMLSKTSISAGGTLKFYYIYVNPLNGDYKDDQGKIFYSPTLQEKVLGSETKITNGSTLDEFISNANLEIKQKGYVVISAGGAGYQYYNIEK